MNRLPLLLDGDVDMVRLSFCGVNPDIQLFQPCNTGVWRSAAQSISDQLPVTSPLLAEHFVRLLRERPELCREVVHIRRALHLLARLGQVGAHAVEQNELLPGNAVRPYLDSPRTIEPPVCGSKIAEIDCHKWCRIQHDGVLQRLRILQLRGSRSEQLACAGLAWNDQQC